MSSECGSSDVRATTARRGDLSRVESSTPAPIVPLRTRPPQPEVDFPPTVLVDVSNVAHGLSEGATPRLRNVELVLAALEKEGVKYSAWADGNLRYKIDRPGELVDLIELDRISEVRGEPADARLLEEANELLRSGLPVYLLSRDRFSEHRSAAGIPRIEFTFGGAEDVELHPPLGELLSAQRYGEVYPDLMPLAEGAPCRHPRTQVQRRGVSVRTICARCGRRIEARR